MVRSYIYTWSSSKLFSYGVPIMRSIVLHQLFKFLILSRPPMASTAHDSISLAHKEAKTKANYKLLKLNPNTLLWLGFLDTIYPLINCLEQKWISL